MAVKAAGKIHGQHPRLFVMPDEIMSLLFVLPKPERWDGSMVDVADIMSRLAGVAVKHPLGKKRDDSESASKATFPSKRLRK